MSTDSINWLTWVPGDRRDVLDQRGVGESLALVGGLALVEEALTGGEVGDAGHDGGQRERPDGEGHRHPGPEAEAARQPGPVEAAVRCVGCVGAACGGARAVRGVRRGAAWVRRGAAPRPTVSWHWCVRPGSAGHSDRQLVAHAPDGEDEAGIGGVGLDLGAQPADVDVDQAPVAEVVIAPDPLEEMLAAQYLARVIGQLAQQAELGPGAVDLLAVAAHARRRPARSRRLRS